MTLYRNEGKFLLTCLGSLLLMGPKEGLEKSEAIENRDSTVIFQIVGKL